MAKKGMSKQGKILAGLTVLSLGLFGYQNIYVPNFVLEKEKVVYVAKEDIPAYSTIDYSMFEGRSISERSVIPGSVTDLNAVAGKKLSGTLKQGELLSNSRLTDESVEQGSLLTEVKIESNLPLKDNDNIRIYIKYQDEGNRFAVEELFKSKKVYTKNSVFGTVEETAGQTQSDGMKFYLKLDQDEVLKYEEAISTGQVIAVKILEDSEIKTTKKNNESDTQTKIVSDKQPVKSQDERGTVQYTVKDGETLSDVAEKFVTTEAKIRELNDGKSSLKSGDKILVPSI